MLIKRFDGEARKHGGRYRIIRYRLPPDSRRQTETFKGPRDQNHVNVNEDYEVVYWTREFDCTEAELRQAVKDAGSTHKDKVRAAVEKNRKK
ncbi:MAG: DUF3606 domain-containing protein [Myxococcales bacterium]|nr:DUF3606 domain-containing protein [Myxococcales bacterium]